MTENTSSETATVTTAEAAPYPDKWKKPSVFYNRFVTFGLYAVILGFFVWSLWESRISIARLEVGVSAIGNVINQAYPPDFGPRDRIWDGVTESLAMGLIATIVGILVSIPIALISAQNISHPVLYWIGRSVISVSRAFHSLILAIIMVAAFGFGALAGVVTLAFSSIGFYAKLLADEIEEMDTTQADALRGTGASTIQLLYYGIYPQVKPRMVGLGVYQWDKHFRESTIIGIVGAGGIGMALNNAIGSYNYDFALAIILVIVTLVLAGEFVSLYLRKQVQ